MVEKQLWSQVNLVYCKNDKCRNRCPVRERMGRASLVQPFSYPVKGDTQGALVRCDQRTK